MLDLEALRREVGEGRIETIITALPDLYGRLVGKRITGHFLPDEIAAGGMHVCNHLLACDTEMDPTPGYSFTSWETGYGDLRAAPDLATLRVADGLEGGCGSGPDRGADDGGARRARAAAQAGLPAADRRWPAADGRGSAAPAVPARWRATLAHAHPSPHRGHAPGRSWRERRAPAPPRWLVVAGI